jgi:hypothetical protein
MPDDPAVGDAPTEATTTPEPTTQPPTTEAPVVPVSLPDSVQRAVNAFVQASTNELTCKTTLDAAVKALEDANTAKSQADAALADALTTKRQARQAMDDAFTSVFVD